MYTKEEIERLDKETLCYVMDGLKKEYWEIAGRKTKSMKAVERMNVLELAVGIVQKKIRKSYPQPLTLEQLTEIQYDRDTIIWLKTQSCCYPIHIESIELKDYVEYSVFGSGIIGHLEKNNYGETWLPYLYEPKEG